MKSYGICRFVATPELRETKDKVKYSNFTLCWNERRKDSKGEWVDTPNFYEFEVWADGAEALCKIFAKGDPIFVEQATARQHNWNDKETGQPRSKIVFRLDKFSPCPRAKAKEITDET